MKLFEIMIPSTTNAGDSYTPQRAEFEEFVLRCAGGLTRGDLCHGLWRPPGEFITYVDGMYPYKIACTERQFARILRFAFKVFADQKSLFTAEVGYATIHSRSGV